MRILLPLAITSKKKKTSTTITITTIAITTTTTTISTTTTTTTTADGFRVGFERWPSSEVVAVPGTEVRLPCSTNDTADKISWKFNSHFLHSPGSGPEYTVPEGFQVVAVQGGSELVVRLSESEAQYADQTGLYQCVAWFGPIALTSLPGKLQAAVLRAPEGEVQQEEVQVVEGGAVRVECEVPYSIPDATLTFYRDGTLLDLTNEDNPPVASTSGH
ncbi:Interference hedgehog [Portunus trituberculatus]|uniref:Interference hedgehog n=1 Tax=Portunus trituberculatus TaxID=210409 RepID=A0A5B7IUL4_PORTR|nr:Interference hedgehog [Portunus trituberculatus]